MYVADKSSFETSSPDKTGWVIPLFWSKLPFLWWKEKRKNCFLSRWYDLCTHVQQSQQGLFSLTHCTYVLRIRHKSSMYMYMCVSFYKYLCLLGNWCGGPNQGKRKEKRVWVQGKNSPIHHERVWKRQSLTNNQPTNERTRRTYFVFFLSFFFLSPVWMIS